VGADAATHGPDGSDSRRPWRGRRIVLGVTGGIAAYKAIQVARDLTRRGAQVDVVLTRSARSFVGAISFEALTGRPVAGDILAEGHALAHIRLAREADVVCIAPATADLVARAAAGRADDLITAILLATRAPVLICPAMNDAMWAHAQTHANIAHLERLGYRIAGPAVGSLAHGEGEGPGRMIEPDAILEHIGRALQDESPLNGARVIVTAGPTREPIDPVRVLSNRSSGRMGYEIAAAAWRRGANVTLITGPSALPAPVGTHVEHVETAGEMAAALTDAMRGANVLVMAAAVADFKPVQSAAAKIRRHDAPSALELEAATDVLAATRGVRPAGLLAIGFALETGDGRASARRKLTEKGLDLIVLNDATEAGAGFEVETNHVILIDREGREQDVPLARKSDIAETILDRIEQLFTNAR
jgi:phosphopantothenoylcysteine decarboxylase/phosphopantothenate--cysteine ligase